MRMLQALVILWLRLFMTDKTSVTRIMNGTVVKISCNVTVKVLISATIPRTRVIVIMLPPITLPMDISCEELKIALQVS